jgi:dihydroorotase
LTTLLKNGKVIDYKTDKEEFLDILIEDNIIKKIGQNLNENKADKVIDCSFLYIIPGMIDIHCHLREPGFEYKETIKTGSASAVKGGFTTVCPMPNTSPVTDNKNTLLEVIKKAKKANLCNVLPYASVTKGQLGEELVDFIELKKAGAIAFSDDGIPVKNAKIMKQGIIAADNLNTFVASHCDQPELAKGTINEGKISKKLNVEGVPKEAEIIMAAREIALAEANNTRVHICHISTKETAAIIRDAKKRGVKVTCETCPHYYSFTEEHVLKHGANAKMNPALRTKEDQKAIIEAIKDGTIDAIITDHAPHSKEEKSQELSKTPNGIIGFETALSATITNLVDKGHISYKDMVKLFFKKLRNKQ